jgi:hypothetical protein
MINLCDVCKLRRELRLVMLGEFYKFFIYIRNNFKDDFVEVQKCMNIYKIDLSKELYLWCGNDKIRIFAIILR